MKKATATSVKLVLVGSGSFSLTQGEAAAIAVRLRELAGDDEAARQSFAFIFERSLAAAADTVVVDKRMRPFLREAVDVLINTAANTPSERVLTLRLALEP